MLNTGFVVPAVVGIHDAKVMLWAGDMIIPLSLSFVDIGISKESFVQTPT